ncbi:MAG: AAA-like domain-containing protein [Cyanobacteria bacterium P01_D01_bin.14]
MSNPVTFTTSGTVQAQDGIYLTRQADEDLLRLCQAGQYAYILTSRQMGKSSLMVATAERLQDEGVKTAIVDLQRLGAQTTTAEQWYLGVLTAIARRLRLRPQLMTFWEANQGLGQADRMVQFLEEIVLPQMSEQLVIFVDEIDSTLNLDFTDDFFIALRYCFTARAENPDFEKLSFVLIGVATPSELIADQKRTPFNIGTLVELQDFTAVEASPLAAGLGLSAAMSQQVLGSILRWTEGHPYLTQRVCEAVMQQPRSAWSETAVDELVEQLFFGEQREQDNNLKFVHSMLVGRAPDKDVLGVLGTYKAIRADRRPVRDEVQSILKSHLKLSGIVKRVGAALQVRNPIYWEVFDPKWVQEQWPETWWQRLKPAMPLIAGLTVGVLGLGGLSVYALEQRNTALAEAERADKAAQEAETARADEAAQRQQAEDALQQAEAERERAIEAEEAAEEALTDAQAAEADALEQKTLADAARDVADELLRREEQARRAETEARQSAEAGEAEAQRQTAIAAAATKEAILQGKIALARQLAIQSGALNLRGNLMNFSRINSVESEFILYLGLDSFSPRLRPFLEGLNPYLVSLSPDGSLIAVSHRDGTYLIDTISGQETLLQNYDSWGNFIVDMRFSPDGSFIATVDNAGLVKLWTIGGEILAIFETGAQDGSQSVSLSPDARFLASVGGNNVIQVWSLDGNLIHTLEGHTDKINSLSFSPSGIFIITASQDKTARIWPLDDRLLTEPVVILHENPVQLAVFTDLDESIGTVSGNSTVRIIPFMQYLHE